ncbi:MAG: alpha/beta fold hydrolase [Candidatus Aegiribacteria sp.]|nr:alpha/beta fold hydrolase [Candidatus Aegiribacteria sp.]
MEKGLERISRVLITGILVAAVVYLAIGVYVYLNQRAFIYFPQRGVLYTGEKPVEIRSGEITLRGWVVNEGCDEAVIYFGGNAERPEANIPDFKHIFDNQTVYLFNYRGYGESGGSPTEEGLYADALAIYDHVSQNHSKVSLIGRSLGTGVATYLASERAVNRLVLIEPFDSMVSVARAAYPVFPVKIMLKDRYDSAGRAGNITARTLVIMAGRDEIIPAWSTERLVSEFDKDILEVLVIEDATHNDIQNYPQYYTVLGEFVTSE